REYRSLDTVFVAHTTDAWEFTESEFFKVAGTGGTVASTGFAKVREIIDSRYSPARHNIYLFYASDGDNSVSDRAEARALLTGLANDACYSGYVEVGSAPARRLTTETGRLFAEIAAAGLPAGSYAVDDFDAIWDALRHFFSAEQQAIEGGRMSQAEAANGWRAYVKPHEELAERAGRTFYPVEFEAVPDSFMMEIAVYGLPVRMPHWSFGVR